MIRETHGQRGKPSQFENPGRTNQLGKEIANSTIGDIGHKGIKGKGPRQRIQERLLQLIKFEVLIADALLIDADSLDGEDAVPRLQPPSVELVVRHDEKEDNAQHSGQTAVDEEDDLPGGDGRTVFARPDRNAVGDQSAEDLSEAVEGEPEADAGALFALRVPLGCEKGESRGDGGFEDAQEDCDNV